MTLVLYRRRASQEEWRTIEVEGARSIGGRGMLWKFNQFLAEKPCQKRDSAKTLLLMLIDVGDHRNYPDHPSPGGPLIQGHSSKPFTPLRYYAREASAAERLRCVLGTLNSLEVKVLRPTRWR
jgi:hypothetical protein